MLALPGVASTAKNSKQLSGAAQELFKNVAAMLDGLVVFAIEKRTAEEFIAARNEVFPKYFEGALGLSYLARTAVPKHVREVLMGEFFSEIEADFRDHGLKAFGTEVRDQAIFTAWTLRKISDICLQIDDIPLSSKLGEADQRFFQEFAFHSMVTRFNLECLFKSMQLQKPIYPEVLAVVVDGLRSAVNAYAWARRALDLRSPVQPAEIAPVIWDDEEQELLNEATFDMLGEPQ